MQEEDRSAYSEALGEIRRTLERRSRNHRNLVVAVVAIVLAGLGWSIMCSCLRGLAVLGGIFPTISLFLLRDLKLTSRWRSRLIEERRSGRLDVPVLRELVSRAPDLPQSTVDGMLSGPGILCPPDPSGGGLREGEPTAPPEVETAPASYWRTRLLGGLVAGLYGAACWGILVFGGSWIFAVALGGVPILMLLARKYAETRLEPPGQT